MHASAEGNFGYIFIKLVIVTMASIKRGPVGCEMDPKTFSIHRKADLEDISAALILMVMVRPLNSFSRNFPQHLLYILEVVSQRRIRNIPQRIQNKRETNCEKLKSIVMEIKI